LYITNNWLLQPVVRKSAESMSFYILWTTQS